MVKKLFLLLCACGLATATEDFESLSGDITSAPIEYGVLQAEPGHARIDVGHGHSGKKALHIKGGENRSVTLVLKEALPEDTPIDFFLERWTRATPYSFTVKADGVDVYKNEKLGAGGYNAHPLIIIPAGTKTITFTATTAEKGGVLIDDLGLHNGPMHIENVNVTVPGAYPVMKGALYNPVIRLHYDFTGAHNPETPGTITFKVTPGMVSKVTLRSGNDEGTRFRESHEYGSAVPAADGTVTLTCTEHLHLGDAHLWIDATPSDAAEVGATITFSDIKVTAGGKTFKPEFGPVTQRVGHVLALPGDPVGNQPNGAEPRPCRDFRIPGAITTKNGTIIACFDARYTHGGDLCADIDVAVTRSTDGGRTWSPVEIALDGGPGDKNGCGDPAIVQDATGRIWIQALTCHFGGGASLWTSKKGNDYHTTGQWEMTYSDDDGKTWSTQHVNPTATIKKDEWHCILAGPGCAITTRDGTIVFPAQIWQNDSTPPSRSTICYSKDGGLTWHMGEGVPFRSSECQVVELPDGSLMLNCRNENRGGKRAVYVTKDLGRTWQEHPSHLQLQEPTCQASIIAIGDGRQLLFSNPKSGRRDHMTIRYSADAGLTWNEGVEYDVRGCAGYSCLVMIDKDTVGVIYEGAFQGPNGETLAICFLRIPLKEIIQAK